MVGSWRAALKGFWLPLAGLAAQGAPPGSERLITGTVREAASSVPLSFAQVHVRGTPTGTQSDERGLFSVRAVAGDVVLVVRHLGHREVVATVAGDIQSPSSCTGSRSAWSKSW
jgi:hypothetical protein